MKNVRKLVYFLVAMLFFITTAHASTYCVKTDGNDANNGTSWSDAFATIQKAIDTSSSGDEIWVAEGTYTLTSQIDVNEDVNLFGGFDPDNGDDTWAERDWRNNKTVVDGNDDVRCFIISGTTIATIDGFTIKDGYTTGNGAGIYMGSGITLTVSNCSLINNDGDGTWSWGGAIYSKGGLTIDNCIFYDNEVKDGGGALGLYQAGTTTIINSCFISNTASKTGGGADGGAIIANRTNATITNCTFYKNFADSYGQTIYSGGDGSKLCNITFKNCIVWDDQNRGYDVACIGNCAGYANLIEFLYCVIDDEYDGQPWYIANNCGYVNWAQRNNQYTLPDFINTSNYDGTDNIWMTSDDGLNLEWDCSYFDNGNNSYVSGINQDILGNDRIANGTVARGAYENNFNIAFQVLSEASGDPVAIFDKFGNLFLGGTLSINQASITASADVNEFRIWDSSGYDIALIDQADANMYITGGKYENQLSITASADVNEFLVKDDDGNIVADVNESGVLLLKGEVYENYLE